MNTILDAIIANKRIEIQQKKSRFTYKDLENEPFFKRRTISLAQSLRLKDFGVIAELKRKSPSAGEIQPDLNLIEKVRAYESFQAAGVSVLMDNKFFGGSTEDMKTVRSLTNLPLLYKEFVIDEFQLFEAKAIGADAVLLISEVLDKQQILHFSIMAKSLGLEVLLELHSKEQLAKINDEVDIIGINNRNLKIQQTDLQTSFDLIDYLPKNKVLISESGIKTQLEMEQLKAVGFQGALIGESLLKSQLDLSFQMI
jgi:indole-3-glycerol phosphate synthase